MQARTTPPWDEALSLAQLEAIRLVLRGGSVIDWHRLNFSGEEEINRFAAVQGLDLGEAQDVERCIRVRDEAIRYLRKTFDFPVPGPVQRLGLRGLLRLASASGHRQLCACAILKVMHIIHHLEARELLFRLPTSDEQVFQWVEAKVYRVIGDMLADGLPVLEFIGGRKNKDSLYSKLLSKEDTLAAQVYDKVRFRVVTRTARDVYAVLNRLLQDLFPFNYVIPGESYNTLMPLLDYCATSPQLTELLPRFQLRPDLEVEKENDDNTFSSKAYRVMHFVVDMPIRVPDAFLGLVGEHAAHLGRVIFAQAEFQLLDQENESRNESGEASHAAYKSRQRGAVEQRLKLGLVEARNPSA